MSVELERRQTTSAAVFARSWRWAVVLVPGALLYLLPVPALDAGQRHLLAFFAATIIALVAQPVPMGVSVLLAMTALVLSGTLPVANVLAGFSDPTVWLIFTAFLFSRAVTQTRLGMRVGYTFIAKFGKRPLTLAYSIACSDLILAPFVPSDTARGGGIISPIVRAVSQALGSEPGTPSGKTGGFLVLIAFHTTYVASAMFLTGMASNPLMADFAFKIGHVEMTWLRWLAGSIVPGVLSLIFVPYLVYRLHPPGLSNTEQAGVHARTELGVMGRMRREERRLIWIMLAVMAGWISSPWHHIPNSFVALAGVSAILVSGVISWNDLLSEGKAWDALIWFAPMIMMADELNKRGIIRTLSQSLFGYTSTLPWLAALTLLVVAYLYIHYGFASMTAQITALYPAFLTAALASGAPPLVAALALAYFSNLDAGITHYGTGSAPVYFGLGYLTQPSWWKFGFLISLLNLVIWLGIGMCWWRLIGLW